MHSHLIPHAREVVIGDSTTRLTNDLAAPASIIVDVNNTISTCSQATLDELIIHSEVVTIQIATKDIVHKILPANWEPEHVETMVTSKMVHLPKAICVSLGGQRRGDAGA